MAASKQKSKTVIYLLILRWKSQSISYELSVVKPHKSDMVLGHRILDVFAELLVAFTLLLAWIFHTYSPSECRDHKLTKISIEIKSDSAYSSEFVATIWKFTTNIDRFMNGGLFKWVIINFDDFLRKIHHCATVNGRPHTCLHEVAYGICNNKLNFQRVN